jgi:cytochrome c peroxidase
MRRAVRLLLAIAVLALGGGQALEAGNPSFRWAIPAWLPPPPVPEDNPMTAEKVELGRHLFYDARLSRDVTIACASCHLQGRAFTDARTVGEGIEGHRAGRNAMGLANVGYLPVLTWANPNIRTLEFQALIPIFGEAPVEMGMAGREQELFARLNADDTYRRLFPGAFPDRDGEVSLFTITRALAAFQRTLISADSPYDRYKYGGDAGALSASARRGEDLFFSHRLECYHCHAGFNFTNNLQTERMAFAEVSFHNNGLYNLDGKGAYPADNTGIREHTGEPADMGRFRTPSLRNVAVTAPYMHDGSAATLDDVIDHYAKAGRELHGGRHAGRHFDNPLRDSLLGGFTLDRQERADLKAFLESLTDTTFLTNPAHGDPWPAGHPATVTRRMSAK